jgi:hypothetical protein
MKNKIDCFAMVENRKNASGDYNCTAPAKYYAESSLMLKGVPVCGIHAKPYIKAKVRLKEI